MTKLLFASDLHGNSFAYKKILDLAVKKDIKNIALGGDLAPKLQILSYFGNIVIPLHPSVFKHDPNGITYVNSLKKIRQFAEKNRTKTIDRFVKLGSWVYHTGVNTSWDNLIREQELISKLNDAIAENNPSNLTKKLDNLFNDPNFLHLPNDQREEQTKKLAEQQINFSEKEREDIEHLLIPKLIKQDEGGKNNYIKESIRLLKYSTISWEDTKFVMHYFNKHKDMLEKGNDHKLIKNLISKEIWELQEKIMNYTRKKLDDSILPLLLKANTLAYHKSNAVNEDIIKKEQSNFFKNNLCRKLNTFKKHNPEHNLYLILGNDDYVETEKDLLRMNNKGIVKYINQLAVPFSNDIFIAGYGFVKKSGIYYAGWEKPEDKIAQDLEELASKSDPKKTIYLMHSPPKDTDLDIAYNGEHIGSESVLNFIHKYQPLAVLSGHCHDSYVKSGKIMQVIGNTPCYNSGGDHNEKKLCAVIIDTDNPSNFERISGMEEIKNEDI